MAGVSIIEPYEGWSCFRPRILEFLEVLRDSALIGKVDRLSIKAMNIISLPGSPMDMLNVEVKVGGAKPPDKGFRVRTEFHDEPYSLIVELISGATVTFQGGEKRSGHYLGLDCVREIGTESFWSIYEAALEEAHQQLKDLFFRLLTPESLESFGPRYE